MKAHTITPQEVYDFLCSLPPDDTDVNSGEYGLLAQYLQQFAEGGEEVYVKMEIYRFNVTGPKIPIPRWYKEFLQPLYDDAAVKAKAKVNYENYFVSHEDLKERLETYL